MTNPARTFFAFCILALLAGAAFAAPRAPVPVQQFVAAHERVRARLSADDRQVLDALCSRVRAVLPRNARLPDAVRAVLARSLPELSPPEVDALADYVSGDEGIGGGAGTGGGVGIGGGTGIGGAAGRGESAGLGAGSAIGAASGGGSQDRLMAATQQMQETQMSFNLQYLQLQSNMQNENRQYTAVSNIMKTKHDTVKNSIRNIR
jgi:hypothetical protein